MKLQVAFVGFLVATVTALLVGDGRPGFGQNPDMLKELKGLFDRGVGLAKQGKNAEAIPFMEKAATLAPKVFGPDHLNTAGILHSTGSIYQAAGKSREAEAYYRRCLEIREAKLPKDDLNLAATLNNLGFVLDQQSKFREAKPILKRCLDIRDAKLPKNSLALAGTLNNLGTVCASLGDYPDAEKYLKRCLWINEALFGKEDVKTAGTLHNLSDTYRLMGRFQEAESLARRSLEIRQAKLGKDHAQVSENLNVLGLLCDKQARYKEADKFFRESLEIREKKLGKNSLAVATCLNNLAILYGHMDRLDEAEKNYRRVLAIRESQEGPDHPEVATALSNYAALLTTVGRNEEAEKQLVRSLAILEAKLGKDHPQVTATLLNLAALYQDQGRLKEAEAFCRRGLAIVESRLGKDHLETATATSNLAMLYVRMNRPREAQPLLQRALKIREERFGKNHPDVGLNLANLGSVAFRTGAYAKATEYYQRSLEIAQASFGKDSDAVAHILLGQTALHQVLGRSAEAVKSQDRCLEIHQARLRNLFGYSSESAMHDYLEANSGKLPMLISLAAQVEDDAAATTAALTWILRLRGAVFDSHCRYRQAQQALPHDAELEQKVTHYRSQKAFLANAAVNPPAGLSADKVKAQVAEAHQEVDGLEKEIRRMLAQKAPNVFAPREAATSALVQKRLPADSVLIEFCRMPIRHFKEGGWSEHRFLVFVLTAGKNAPKFIDLGPAKDIDDGVEALRKEFIDFQEKLAECENVEEAKTLEKSLEKQFKAKSAALHAKLMAPLAKAIGDARLLYIAADGALNRLPFECLVDADGKYLVERQRCAYLSSGRDLLRTPGKLAKGTVVFAGPDYKLEAAERLAQAEKLLNKKEPLLALRNLPGRDLRSAGFKPLPGAAAEAKDIQKALAKSDYGPVTAYVGAEALEEVLKAMPAPRVLHLATHGFFLDRETGTPEESDGYVGAGSARRRLRRMENPLLRSGIVLAGANTIGDKDTPTKVEDGWVTAEEIAMLNLHGTELVVLSACQTGLGDIKTGEGVYGLRRAFLYAGAQTLVTSLFEVPDTETRDLMQRFYTGFSAGKGKLLALHGAQVGLIEARRQTRGAAHPFYWASFVLVGSPD